DDGDRDACDGAVARKAQDARPRRQLRQSGTGPRRLERAGDRTRRGRRRDPARAAGQRERPRGTPRIHHQPGDRLLAPPRRSVTHFHQVERPLSRHPRGLSRGSQRSSPGMAGTSPAMTGRKSVSSRPNHAPAPLRTRPMRRRDLIASLAATAVAGPLAAIAQQPERVRRVGVLLPFAEHDPLTVAMVNSFVRALGRFGWIEQKNIRIDYRFSEDDPERLSPYAAELVGLTPDALLAAIPPAITALRQRTSTIPIVFEF